MSQQGIVRCYTLILEKVMSPLKCTFNDLRHTLHNQGFEVSDRTLQRYIENIRTEFNINIIYDRFNNQYLLDNEDREQAEQFMYVMGIQHTGAMLGKQLSKKSLKFISPDVNATFKGIEWIDPLLKAMQRSMWIEIMYKKFGSEQANVYRLQPYLLKEYQYRWYLFARLGDDKPFRTFGLDRIEKVNIGKNSFKRDAKIDPRAYFNNIIGLVYDNNEPLQQVVLRVEKTQASYLKTLPIHPSQHIIKEDKSAIDFAYHIIPNFELTQRILTLADEVAVIKPKWLRNEIARIGKAIAKNNSKN